MTDDPWLTLAAEVIKLAAKDARRGDPSAAAWLRSDGAALLLEAFDIEPAAVDLWLIRHDCPRVSVETLTQG